MKSIIGRISEVNKLEYVLKSNKPELIAIHGRRRIGKTFLIRNFFKKQFVFEFSGTYQTSLKQQLKNFHLMLSKKHKTSELPTDWFEAFYQLSDYLNNLKSKEKKVIFLDEFPWLDTRKSNFLAAFDHFWNSYASTRSDLIVVICGSAASYMIKNIIQNKGGLHNRITEQIRLAPFNLLETEQLLKKNKVKLTRYDILQLYMAIGGVPHYIEKVIPGESVAQAIDRLCFEKNGFLRTEFSAIFSSLFDQYENHEHIVRVLASVRKGFTRSELLAKIKLKSGGTLSKTLSELEASGFIEKYLPYKGNKDALFRLTDEYSLFYIKFIEKSNPTTSENWLKIRTNNAYKVWTGFTFETICIKHIEQIKEGLKIRGIYSANGSWVSKQKETNTQIDLLIDRDDQVINLCEMKFSNQAFTIDKKTTENMIEKINIFKTETKTNKSIFLTFITTFGLKKNSYSNQIVQNELSMDALFTSL